MRGVEIFLICLFGYLAITTVLSASYFSARGKLKKLRAEYAAYRARYSRVSDVEDERAKIVADSQALFADLTALRAEYAQKRAIFQQLEAGLQSLEAAADMADIGIHQPVFELDSHAEYVAAINGNQADQKAMVSQKTAVVAQTTWTVDGKVSEGRKMADRAVRLSLRAFNNECDVLMTKITWKNLPRISERIQKSASTIDSLNDSLKVTISSRYISLKLREAKLRQEEALKKQEEKEELRRQREEEREEAKAQREYAAEVQRQERREREKAAALAAARSELEFAAEADRVALESRIASLEGQLSEAMLARTRVLSMAEQTRVGYVYVISNSGAFGNRVFKIGMTRRLEPMDRIQELGDASVPFPFDVHALIFTDNAPRLERELHDSLSDRRVNRVNMRKEFFRADLETVKALIQSRFPGVPFADAPESSEHAMSMTMEEAEERAHGSFAHGEDVLPVAI